MKLAVSEGKDIFFSHLTWKDGLSPGSIRQILQDDRGFLWINTSGVLNRYDGNQFKSYRRDAAHPNNPAGSFLQYVLKDRTGDLWVSSNESFDRFDPATETSTRFAIDRDGLHSVRGPSSTSCRTALASSGFQRPPVCIDSIRRRVSSATILTTRMIRTV